MLSNPTHLQHHITTEARRAVREVKNHYMRLGAYAHLKDLRCDGSFRLPTWSENDLWTFLEASEKGEQRRRRWLSVLRCSLPRGLTESQQLELNARYIDQLLADKSGGWVLHAPIASDGGKNEHVHILFSSRVLDGHERPADQYFATFNPRHVRWGGAPKDREMAYPSWEDKARTLWRSLAEEALEEAGVFATTVATPSVVLPEDDGAPLSIAQSLARRATGFRHLFPRGRKESHAESV